MIGYAMNLHLTDHICAQIEKDTYSTQGSKQQYSNDTKGKNLENCLENEK